MDPNKKIVDLTPEELTSLGYLSNDVAPGVKRRVERVLADPVRLGSVTVFMVECMIRRNPAQAASQDAAEPPASPTSPTSPTRVEQKLRASPPQV
ncbi:hypothetical protein NLJ89_g9885 [Agrocybe chaxingu]|uniref:Uncharacterized protein n=1 Tax=Agrocybe chaxingu TaxID=84603 RepID=A0A9W8JRL2_9AGAR|nr:hypothetical protein NLJ89_g9885 [Agrocybe chaxingu]